MSDDKASSDTTDTVVAGDVVSSKCLAFCRGRRLYHGEGAAQPVNVWPDEEWNGPLNDGQCEWLGYMVERGLQLLRQERLREWAEQGGTFPA